MSSIAQRILPRSPTGGFRSTVIFSWASRPPHFTRIKPLIMRNAIRFVGSVAPSEQSRQGYEPGFSSPRQTGTGPTPCCTGPAVTTPKQLVTIDRSTHSTRAVLRGPRLSDAASMESSRLSTRFLIPRLVECRQSSRSGSPQNHRWSPTTKT